MTAWRTLALVLFFVGLVALEISHGLYRLNSSSELRRRELIAQVERGHAELARHLESLLADGRREAQYLARLPALAELLAADEEVAASRDTLQTQLLPFVETFGDVERLAVLLPDGHERFRGERGPRGASAAVPAALGHLSPDEGGAPAPGGEALRDGDVLTVLRRLPAAPGGVERLVIDHLCAIDRAGVRRGYLALRLSAAPLLEAVRRFRPIEGVTAHLVDARQDRAWLDTQAADADESAPPAELRQLLAEGRLQAERALWLALPLGREPLPLVVARTPEAALDGALAAVRDEQQLVIVSMVAVTLLLAGAAAIALRMNARAQQQKETERELADLTRQRELEQRLQTSERLGAIGLLTAGVAHEINNPLEGIGNYLSLLQKEGLDETQRRRYLERVGHGFQRIRDIVRELLHFSRPATGSGEADLAQVVERSLAMAAYSASFQGVEVQRSGLEAPLPVRGDAGRLEQVLLNLLLNAADAMRRGASTPGAGAPGAAPPDAVQAVGAPRIIITALRSSASAGTAGTSGEVRLDVEDEGPGIAAEDLPRLFDPFFSRSGGTGLGLSVSYGIVSAHGGTLTASNRAQGGARFSLRLPAA